MFKLKMQNVAFWAVAPSLFSQYCYGQAINDRVDNLWRIHKNRESKGMGGTAQATGVYREDEHVGDRAFRINNGLHLSFDSIISGLKGEPVHNNHFTRFHQSLQDYGHEHGNMDDEKLFETENYERFKSRMPKNGSVVGTTTLIPTADTDEKLIWFDAQGESLYTNPPDPNVPVVDHGLDEDKIWAFRKSNYNQDVIYNAYTRDIWSAIKEHNAPWWGKKLAAPAFYKDAKFAKFWEQYKIRIDFERLKLKHARELRAGDLAQRDQQTREVEAFLADAKQQMAANEMKDVYVTDHKHKAPQYSTLSEDEDVQYYNYVRSVQAYNNQAPARNAKDAGNQFESGRFARGSFLQRALEPLAGATKLENGTLFYEVQEKEIASQLDEARLRKVYEQSKELGVIEAEDEGEINAAMVDAVEAAGYDMAEWDAILSRELNTFKEGESYDYVTDLRRTFNEGVSTSLGDKIFRKLPNHVFYDIKKPLHKDGTYSEYYLNPYNTARKYPFQSFTDMRRHEQWL